MVVCISECVLCRQPRQIVVHLLGIVKVFGGFFFSLPICLQPFRSTKPHHIQNVCLVRFGYDQILVFAHLKQKIVVCAKFADGGRFHRFHLDAMRNDHWVFKRLFYFH